MSTQKTVRVRIAVAVSPNGAWKADGCRLSPLWSIPEADPEIASTIFAHQGIGHVVFVECDVPLPEALVLEGTVVA